MGRMVKQEIPDERVPADRFYQSNSPRVTTTNTETAKGKTIMRNGLSSEENP